ncbi:MAG: FAD-dependent oxidoreductase [Candidatus Hodarchaeales archaeon]|jgi:NADPH-dependent 2,4-dienoyl-CoA reductase/sulfur reductase-like enzyme/Fe-S-cluster-containing hydrogenase component 2/bacterioferritin-associated ferredoxin
MKNRIINHPILSSTAQKLVKFSWNGETMEGMEGMVISSVLFMNGVKAFGHHPKDQSPQGIFCANGQCAQCTVLVNLLPQKACMTSLQEGMDIRSCSGLPELPTDDRKVKLGLPPDIFEIEVLIIGAGPAGLSATEMFGKNNIKVILIDDKDKLGGKLVLQTHKFFGSQEDVYAGKRGIDIASKLSESVRSYTNVDIWLNSTVIAIFSDKIVGVVKNSKEYVLVKPNKLLIATGAREKMLIFPGDTLPGVYGAGAFQTLVNRDLVRAANRVFIVGGGNVGLIAGYHAIQAGIEVVGLVEALPRCGGYKVHEDKLRRLGVPIFTSHTIVSANGTEHVESITIGELNKNWEAIPGTEKSFSCDTILIAIGLDPVDEFYNKAKEFNLNVRVAGDAQEIAEASAAIFTGKIEAIKILQSMGVKPSENLRDLEEKAKLMKERPPPPISRQVSQIKEGIIPVFHCDQEIPCNPCTSVCPQGQIKTDEDVITHLPFFLGQDECINCGRCVAVCPGLAITILDYRKDQKNPLVTFPYELSHKKLEKGEKVVVMGDKGVLGQFRITRARFLKDYPRTQLVTVKLPLTLAKTAVNIRTQLEIVQEPLDMYIHPPLSDDAIICRCERVKVREIREWIKKGIIDINQLKALTHVQMGACGGKTCTSLIDRIYKEEGIRRDQVTHGTQRPLFIEVPFRIFAQVREVSE